MKICNVSDVASKDDTRVVSDANTINFPFSKNVVTFDL